METKKSSLKVKSCYSTQMDPYQAGIELGQALSEIQPEGVFLFSSIHYAGSRELVEAIFDILGDEDLILIGNTGYGFYEHDKVAKVGVSALGINAKGKLKWHLTTKSGVGKGYPRGLKKEEIPLAARIFAIIDVWGALNSQQPYRPPWSQEEILTHIRENSGKYFDPAVVEAFLQIIQ